MKLSFLFGFWDVFSFGLLVLVFIFVWSDVVFGVLKFWVVLEKLKFSCDDIFMVVGMVKGVVDYLLFSLKCDFVFSGVGLLNIGSYYEYVKVSCLVFFCWVLLFGFL